MKNGREAPAAGVPLAPTSPWWGERRSRYHFSARWVRGQVVLDVACGTGFGSEILADAGARFVVGADLKHDPVPSHARPEELAFVAAEATELPFCDGSFDVVTSFDTIGHVHDDAAFARELCRVLKPAGTLLLSTQNALRARRAARNGRSADHHPVREYEPERLRALFGQHFGEVALLGQVTKDYYPVSPLWEDPRDLPSNGLTRLRTLAWRVEDRLPFALKDGMSRLLHNRAFFPGEFDFDFLPEHVDRGHVTIAVCRP